MALPIKLEVWGEFAAFNRPELKVERMTYDVITPSAARGILEAIYWKPQMRWVIDELRVLSPIRFTQFRRNEITSKIPVKGASGVASAMREGAGNLGIAVDDSSQRAQRAAIVLCGVRYGIAAHLQVLDATDVDGQRLGDPEAKHLEMFRRRAARGQYFHHPYLGSREYPAEFRLVDTFPPVPAELLGVRDLGLMLHDVEFVADADGPIIESYEGTARRAHPRFFRVVMNDGVIRVPELAQIGR